MRKTGMGADQMGHQRWNGMPHTDEGRDRYEALAAAHLFVIAAHCSLLPLDLVRCVAAVRTSAGITCQKEIRRAAPPMASRGRMTHSAIAHPGKSSSSPPPVGAAVLGVAGTSPLSVRVGVVVAVSVDVGKVKVCVAVGRVKVWVAVGRVKVCVAVGSVKV